MRAKIVVAAALRISGSEPWPHREAMDCVFIPLSQYQLPSPVEGIPITAQKPLPVLLLVAALVAVAFVVAVIGVFKGVMFLRTIVLMVAPVFLTRAQSVAIAGIKRHVRIAPT